MENDDSPKSSEGDVQKFYVESPASEADEEQKYKYLSTNVEDFDEKQLKALMMTSPPVTDKSPPPSHNEGGLANAHRILHLPQHFKTGAAEDRDLEVEHEYQRELQERLAKQSIEVENISIPRLNLSEDDSPRDSLDQSPDPVGKLHEITIRDSLDLSDFQETKAKQSMMQEFNMDDFKEVIGDQAPKNTQNNPFKLDLHKLNDSPEPNHIKKETLNENKQNDKEPNLHQMNDENDHRTNSQQNWTPKNQDFPQYNLPPPPVEQQVIFNTIQQTGVVPTSQMPMDYVNDKNMMPPQQYIPTSGIVYQNKPVGDEPNQEQWLQGPNPKYQQHQDTTEPLPPDPNLVSDNESQHVYPKYPNHHLNAFYGQFMSQEEQIKLEEQAQLYQQQQLKAYFCQQEQMQQNPQQQLMYQYNDMNQQQQFLVGQQHPYLEEESDIETFGEPVAIFEEFREDQLIQGPPIQGHPIEGQPIEDQPKDHPIEDESKDDQPIQDQPIADRSKEAPINDQSKENQHESIEPTKDNAQEKRKIDFLAKNKKPWSSCTKTKSYSKTYSQRRQLKENQKSALAKNSAKRTIPVIAKHPEQVLNDKPLKEDGGQEADEPLSAEQVWAQRSQALGSCKSVKQPKGHLQKCPSESNVAQLNKAMSAPAKLNPLKGGHRQAFTEPLRSELIIDAEANASTTQPLRHTVFTDDGQRVNVDINLMTQTPSTGRGVSLFNPLLHAQMAQNVQMSQQTQEQLAQLQSQQQAQLARLQMVQQSNFVQQMAMQARVQHAQQHPQVLQYMQQMAQFQPLIQHPHMPQPIQPGGPNVVDPANMVPQDFPTYKQWKGINKHHHHHHHHTHQDKAKPEQMGHQQAAHSMAERRQSPQRVENPQSPYKVLPPISPAGSSKQSRENTPQSSPSLQNVNQAKRTPYRSPPKAQHEKLPVDTSSYLEQMRRAKEKKAAAMKFKQYTVEDYRKLKHDVRLGGLGPDFESDKLKEQREKRERQVQYAKNIAHKNKRELELTPRSSGRKNDSEEEDQADILHRRRVALEYAKNIPKPKIKTPTEKHVPGSEERVPVIRQQTKGFRDISPTSKHSARPVEKLDLDTLKKRHEEEKVKANLIRQHIQPVKLA